MINRLFRGMSRLNISSVPENGAPAFYSGPSEATHADDFRHVDRFLVDFNASHSGVALRESFCITKSSACFVSLAFAATEQSSVSDLSDLLRTKKVLISKYDLDSVTPTKVSLRGIMNVFNCTLDEASARLWEGVRDGSYVYRPVDGRGVIPLWIQLQKVDDGASATMISNVCEGLDIVGQILFAEGLFGFERKVAKVDLTPGRYVIEAKTLQDTPELFGARIKFGLSHASET